jgi:hypothetical protein
MLNPKNLTFKQLLGEFCSCVVTPQNGHFWLKACFQEPDIPEKLVNKPAFNVPAGFFKPWKILLSVIRKTRKKPQILKTMHFLQHWVFFQTLRVGPIPWQRFFFGKHTHRLAKLVRASEGFMREAATPLLRRYSKHAAGALCASYLARRVWHLSRRILYMDLRLAGSETHVLAPGRATNTMAPQTS